MWQLFDGNNELIDPLESYVRDCTSVWSCWIPASSTKLIAGSLFSRSSSRLLSCGRDQLLTRLEGIQQISARSHIGVFHLDHDGFFSSPKLLAISLSLNHSLKHGLGTNLKPENKKRYLEAYLETQFESYVEACLKISCQMVWVTSCGDNHCLTHVLCCDRWHELPRTVIIISCLTGCRVIRWYELL